MVFALWLYGIQSTDAKRVFVMTTLAWLALWALWFAVSLHSRRQKAMRFVAVNLALVFAMAGLELSAKFIDYRHIFGKRMSPWENTKNLLDRELIHVHRPHYRAKGQMNGGDLTTGGHGSPAVTFRPYDVQYDRNGFRNNVDYEQVDCVVIGDSFVEAESVLSDEIFTFHMADESGMTVANLGQSGYGPQQELEVLKRFGVPLQPRVCVWLFFEGNDLSDVWRYRELKTNWPASVSGYSSWKERSFTMNACAFIATAFDRSNNATIGQQSGLFTQKESRQRLWFGYVDRELSARDYEALKITTTIISEAYTLCQQHDIQFVVAFAPTKFRVYADFCSFEENSPVQEWTLNSLPERFAESIQKISGEIAFVDLTSSLQNAARSGQIVYYPDDTHWSPEGHQVAGRAISNVLRTRLDNLPSEVDHE